MIKKYLSAILLMLPIVAEAKDNSSASNSNSPNTITNVLSDKFICFYEGRRYTMGSTIVMSGREMECRTDPNNSINAPIWYPFLYKGVESAAKGWRNAIR